MTPVDAIGLLLAAGLLVYLVIALLYPDRFQ
jgi:K+-transporting ATPase KdpF subunit